MAQLASVRRVRDSDNDNAPDGAPGRKPDRRDCHEGIADVRDGLTRLERIVLVELQRAQSEFEGRSVPTALLYGRVVEQIDVGVPAFQRCLKRLMGR